MRDERIIMRPDGATVIAERIEDSLVA
jgi:hypothetical protein